MEAKDSRARVVSALLSQSAASGLKGFPQGNWVRLFRPNAIIAVCSEAALIADQRLNPWGTCWNPSEFRV